jgi:hypothetical protein
VNYSLFDFPLPLDFAVFWDFFVFPVIDPEAFRLITFVGRPLVEPPDDLPFPIVRVSGVALAIHALPWVGGCSTRVYSKEHAGGSERQLRKVLWVAEGGLAIREC